MINARSLPLSVAIVATVSFGISTGCGTKGSQTASTLYSVGGNVHGLTGTLKLQNNGADTLSINTDGPFSFATSLKSGAAYSVTVQQSPADANCTVAAGSGTVGNANITNIVVTCAAGTPQSLGGTVSGLTGTVQLQNNGGDTLTVSANGNFVFHTAVYSGSDYNVTVSSAPSGETCSVGSGSGTVGNANITNVAVSCSENPYYLNITYQNLDGTDTDVVNDANVHLLPASGASSGKFSTVYNVGDSYTVAVDNQPQDNGAGHASQVCSINPNSGVFGSADVTVTMTCVAAHYLNLDFQNLTGSSADFEDNQSDHVTPQPSDTSGTFPMPYISGQSYSVDVAIQPQDSGTGAQSQVCTVNNPNTGVFASTDVTLTVSCVDVHVLNVMVTKTGSSAFEVSDDFGDPLIFSDTNGPFPFGTLYQTNADYHITITQSPTGQTCTLDTSNTTDSGAHAVSATEVDGTFADSDITVAFTCQ